ncbi:hypothetical protein [Streptomyces sp. MT206]|uniref:hypothetical protein n=1 Tax=Streptomyces sp. MT206 TaxID=3031407 RepID=UPI002FC6FF02
MHTRMPDLAADHRAEARPRPSPHNAAAPAARLHTTATTQLPGRLAVEFLTASGRPGWGQLTQRPTGTLVTAVGTVTVLHVLDSVMVVTLTGSTGNTALCSIDSDHYVDFCSYLCDGSEVEVCGKVRRPAYGPSPLIDALTIRPATSARHPGDNAESEITSERAAVARRGVNYRDGDAARSTSAKQWRRVGDV